MVTSSDPELGQTSRALFEIRLKYSVVGYMFAVVIANLSSRHPCYSELNWRHPLIFACACLVDLIALCTQIEFS